MTVRKLQAGDEIPFKHGLEPLALDPNWAWVAVEGERIVGLLLACGCHNSVFLVRLICQDAPKTCIRQLIRKCAQDVRQAGYLVAFCYFDLERDEEVRLVKLMANHSKDHGGVLASRHAICVTAIDKWIK